MRMDKLKIKINRKRSFSGFLLPLNILVGGKASPALKNGGSAELAVKRERVIFVEDQFSITNNAVIFTSFEDEIGLDVRLTGSTRKGYRFVFCPEGSKTPYPSLSFDRLLEGLEGERSINEAQRKLALLVFLQEAFDIEEVLRSKHVNELIEALKDLGATLYASTLERIIAANFSGFPLPIEGGEDDEEMKERFEKAEEMQLDADDDYRLTEELARAAANHISAHYSELFTDDDLYYFDGSEDLRGEGSKQKLHMKKGKTEPDKKRVPKLILAVLIFIAVECVMLGLWRHGAYYPARAALENNSYSVTLKAPLIELEKGYGKYEGDKIHITSGGETYTLDWSNKPRAAERLAKELVSEIEKEETLTLVVKDGGGVCAVYGEKETYLSVEDFNRYQKVQSIIGTVLLVIFELIAVFVFAVALLILA